MLEAATISAEFDYGTLLAGGVSGLLLAMLLQIRWVAILVATGLAAALLWTILDTGSHPAAVFELLATRLQGLAATGFLTGMLIAKSAAALVRGLVRTAGRPGDGSSR